MIVINKKYCDFNEKWLFKKKWLDLSLAFLHIFAMGIPFGRMKNKLYKMRGTKIGKNVDISSFVFLEEYYPNLITIEDNVDIGPYVKIVTHDSSMHCINPSIPNEFGAVLIKKNVYIGAGAIILPGVTIGEFSIIAAGAVVTGNIPPYTVVAGIPAKKIGSVQDKITSSSCDIE